jgi:hypothetical protein
MKSKKHPNTLVEGVELATGAWKVKTKQIDLSASLSGHHSLMQHARSRFSESWYILFQGLGLSLISRPSRFVDVGRTI